MTPHPGKSDAQRRVLDEIGSGNVSPVASKRTIDAMLRAGLIVEMTPDEVPFLGSLYIRVRRFDMPIPVHMQWCDYWSEQPFEEDELAAFAIGDRNGNRQDTEEWLGPEDESAGSEGNRP